MSSFVLVAVYHVDISSDIPSPVFLRRQAGLDHQGGAIGSLRPDIDGRASGLEGWISEKGSEQS